ncbi:hypothetical protein HanXRQr2_Chr07g0279311 [Helianthus annuus]|uniref:Uncharacterized protein n=1 Tax=Helianthus annuus TaxID=4232 RepID=A0A251UAB9_HELAN|nr:hypothetical protein HanXRQr2_Chr07g0279311 [Helianthus annuus]
MLIRLPYDIAVTLSFNSRTQSETLISPLHWIICIFCFPIFCSSYLQSRVLLSLFSRLLQDGLLLTNTFNSIDRPIVHI